jgi:phenylpyruvate tautomerase PptA (4-oxalocrotonate tautomerase family)
MEYLNVDQVAYLVSCLSSDLVVTLAVSSQQTRRILQTLFEHHKTEHLDPIVKIMATEASRLAVTQQGCIALMRVLENATENQKKQLIAGLSNRLSEITTDQYGNYVVQCIIQNFPRETVSQMVEHNFAGKWVQLSCNKFGSNVMEKVMQVATPGLRRVLVDELVLQTTQLNVLMHDGFGNFVLQAIVESCNSPQEFHRLQQRIRPLLANCPYGHKIEGKLRGKRFARGEE